MPETPQGPLASGGRSVNYRCEHDVAWITIDRPTRANAIDPATADAIAKAVALAEADDGVRVMVLTGSGRRSFCAGSDLKAKAQGAPPAVSSEWGFAGFVRAPRTKPAIAAVNGAAAGGGFELVLACDLVVAVSHALFSLPEVTVGLVAGGGGLIRLPRRLPPALANEVVLAGRRLTAMEALNFGLINQVVEDAELIDAARVLARRCASGAPLAVRESLAVMAAAEGSGESGLWDRSWLASQLVADSQDGKEGPKAFAEGRTPEWVGR